MAANPQDQVIETTVGEVAAELLRLGVPKDRLITVMIEPDDWLTKARQESRRLVVAAGLGDADTEPNLAETIRKRFAPLGGVDLEPHPPVTIPAPS